MKLSKLLKEVSYELIAGDADIEVEDVAYDSRKVGPGTVFVCVPGFKTDAHQFIPQVIELGAEAIVVSKDISSLGLGEVDDNGEIENEFVLPSDITVVKVADSRLALGLMMAELFGHPERKMTTIGITGTKGKTTTSYMLKSIIESAGRKVGLIGTNGVMIGDKHYNTRHTTPESYELYHYFSMMVDAGCKYMIMEVSSQGIKMHRIAGIQFDIGIFTNISPDHIGPTEHASFEEYLSYKAKLFTLCKDGIINMDDPHYEQMRAGATATMHTIGKSEKADMAALDIKDIYTNDFMGSGFTYRSEKRRYEVKVSIPGIFNTENALAAIAAAELINIPQPSIVEALSKVQVKGRMEIAHVSEHCSVIIDYAHNGMSARSLLATLKAYEPKRLVVVFGCGGNRDPHRRYEMGEAVGETSDFAVITNDNPRFEDPAAIIKDIHIGLDKTAIYKNNKFIEIPDRREAIRWTIEKSEPGDMIAIIGKGHEEYQEVCGERTHLSDREEVDKVIAKLGW